MRFLNRQPIRRQVVFAASVLLIPLVVAGAWSVNRARSERATEVREQAGSIAATAAAALNQYFGSLDAMASVLVRHPAVRSQNAAECTSLFAELLRDQPLLTNVVLRRPDASLVASAVAPSGGPNTAVPYVTQVVKTAHPVVSDLIPGPITGKPTVILGYPVPGAGGRVVGVVAFGLNLMRLQTVFQNIPLPEGSVVTLFDRKSRVLTRTRDVERFIGTEYDTRAAEPKDVQPTRIRTGFDGIERYYGNAVIDRGPWLLSVGIPTAVVAARVLPLWRRNLATVAAVSFASLLLLLWISRALSRDLDHLRRAAQRIADGDLSPPVKAQMENLELAQLQNAFTTMAAGLRETRDALDRQVEQERKTREMLQSLQRQVVRQERLAAVGLLVSGVAHELNNPLQAILGTAELLERHQGMTSEAIEEIGFVKTQSGRAREIIRNLSRFSSQQSGPPTLVDLRDVIAEVVQLRRRDLDNSSIGLDVELETARNVHANFTELEQVTLNFVINAQQAIESTGRTDGQIRIRLSDMGKRVRLEVIDNGPGVRPEDEPKLFQPFFTTKPVGKGTGLGLSVSYGIIDSYGGSIGYHGNMWGGATFFFELPAEESPTKHDASAVLHRSVLPRV